MSKLCCQGIGYECGNECKFNPSSDFFESDIPEYETPSDQLDNTPFGSFGDSDDQLNNGSCSKNSFIEKQEDNIIDYFPNF